jgi:hypothetical protein
MIHLRESSFGRLSCCYRSWGGSSTLRFITRLVGHMAGTSSMVKQPHQEETVAAAMSGIIEERIFPWHTNHLTKRWSERLAPSIPHFP